LKEFAMTRCCLRVAAFLAVLALPVQAQVTTSTILGTVRDRSGAVVPGATVTAVQVETNFTRSTTADNLGQYQIGFLPLGAYRIDVDADGFKRFQQTGILLDIGRQARVDAMLDVGSVSESVEVTGDAPQVNTINATLGRTVNNEEVVNLPLVNRNLYTLLTLTPGVDTSSAGSVGNPEQQTTVNGTPNANGAVSYFLDGGPNASPIRNTGAQLPNPDAVAEFRVITNAFGAEFGRFAGGVIDIVTKSGTNQFHGSLFEFLRNDKLNARIWNASRRPPLRRNQFGGAIGGPIVRDRAFFFFSYSGLRQREPVFRNSAIVPTPAERGGDFSLSRIRPRDPDTGQLFAGGIIPVTRLDPTAVNIMNEAVPLANLPNNFYEVTETRPQNTDDLTWKVDHSLGANHRLSGSYFRATGFDRETLAGTLPWSRRRMETTQHNFNASDTWTISPSMVNQLRVSYMRYITVRENTPAKTLADFGSQFRVQGTPSLPQIQVGGYFNLNQAIAGPMMGGNVYGVRQMLSITRGRHSMKMGGDFALDKMVQYTDLNNYGTFNFDGARTLNGFADYLLGRPRTMNQDAPIEKSVNGWYNSLYFQDDIRLHPRFTLNIGVRYELQLPMTDPHDRLITFIPGRQSTAVPAAPIGLLFPGDAGISRGIMQTDGNNFAPRAGFAWDPVGRGKTSIRGGAGLFYSALAAATFGQVADRQPFTVRQQFNNVKSLTEPYALLPGGVSPFPYVYDPVNPRFLANAAIGGIGADFKWPYLYQLNFTIDHQVSRDLSVSGGYVGTLARNFTFNREVNYPEFRPGATTGNVNSRRPFNPGILSNIQMIEPSATSNYHGLQLNVDKRMAQGFSFKGFYTFSKTIGLGGLEAGNMPGSAQNHTKLFLDRGRSSADRTHNFVLSGIWEINYVQDGPALARWLANGWQLSSILSLRSGQPFSVTTGRDNNLDGANFDRANLAGDPHLSANRPRQEVLAAWFNTAAFNSLAGGGEDGTSGVNILDGPGLRNVDLGIFRNFRIREGIQMQFRTEMTNAFNLVSLGGPITAMNNAAFGTIRTAGQMRQIQFGLRLAF
jgi:hypothetical protein